MTAGYTTVTELGGSSELQDELEVLEEIENGQQVMASLAREFKFEDSWAELILDADIKLPEAAADSE